MNNAGWCLASPPAALCKSLSEYRPSASRTLLPATDSAVEFDTIVPLLMLGDTSLEALPVAAVRASLFSGLLVMLGLFGFSAFLQTEQDFRIQCATVVYCFVLEPSFHFYGHSHHDCW
ncbi:MAG: hypothetical protein L0H08_12715 [Comamonas sp.]|nr:hypothetical protein [Comamonas sp.]MDN5537824.1 hypothetical protein [Comamonas sp.]